MQEAFNSVIPYADVQSIHTLNKLFSQELHFAQMVLCCLDGQVSLLQQTFL